MALGTQSRTEIWGLPLGVSHFVKPLKFAFEGSIPVFVSLPHSTPSVEPSPDSSWPHGSEESPQHHRNPPNSKLNSLFSLLRGPAEPGGVTDIPDRPSPATVGEMKTKGKVFFGKQELKRFYLGFLLYLDLAELRGAVICKPQVKINNNIQLYYISLMLICVKCMILPTCKIYYLLYIWSPG